MVFQLIYVPPPCENYHSCLFLVQPSEIIRANGAVCATGICDTGAAKTEDPTTASILNTWQMPSAREARSAWTACNKTDSPTFVRLLE